MSHEQSKTIQKGNRWINISGLSGQPLPPRYEFESVDYPTVSAAVSAAKERSRRHGMANEFLNENVGNTALDLINQLRGMNFTPSEGEMPRVSADPNELARHTVRDRAYSQMREAAPEAPSYLSRATGAVGEGLNRLGGAMIDPWRQLLQGNLRGAAASAATAPGRMAMHGAEAAFAPATEAIRKYVSEPIATGGSAGRGRLAAGALAEGALEGAVGGIGKLGKVAKGAKGAKIPRARPGVATTSERLPGTRGSFGEELMERRGPERMSDEQFAALRAQRGVGEGVPNPQGFEPMPSFRDPISHRPTEMDPGFFGPLIENYYKSLGREGIGPAAGGTAAAILPFGLDERIKDALRSIFGMQPVPKEQQGLQADPNEMQRRQASPIDRRRQLKEIEEQLGK